MYIYKVSANAYFYHPTEINRMKEMETSFEYEHQTCKFILLCCNMKTVHHWFGFKLTHTNVHYNRKEPLPTIVTLQSWKMGSVFCAAALHIILLTESRLENAAFASASNATIFQHIWLPENYTYIDVGVSFDVTTLVKCAAFSQYHASKHNGFDFKQGKCALYMLPDCVDLNSTSAVLQSTGIGVGIFRKSKNY